MFRSVSLAALTAVGVLSAAPTPQSFHQPLLFEPNRGQAPPEVHWLARGPGYQLMLTDNGITMRLREKGQAKNTTLRMSLEGSRPWKNVTGLEPTGGASNYVRGRQGEGSLTQIQHYARVRVAGVYDGVDLVFYSRGGDLEYDFIIQPGASYQRIRLAFGGQRQMRVDKESGDLLLTTAGGSELRHVRPAVYQQIENRRVEVAGGYEAINDTTAAFRLASFDRKRALVIDPTVSFTRFLAGSTWDIAYAVAVDADGNSYITGATHSGDFPVSNAYDGSYQECDHDFLGFCTGGDGFITKLAPDGTILFSTYFGAGEGLGIAVDSTGVVVAGDVIPGSDPDTFTSGGSDGYVLKLSLTGVPIFTRFYDGNDNDVATSIAFDSQHAIWVAGYTRSKDFVGQSYPRTSEDVFVAKLGPAGERLFTQTWGSDSYDFA